MQIRLILGLFFSLSFMQSEAQPFSLEGFEKIMESYFKPFLTKSMTRGAWDGHFSYKKGGKKNDLYGCADPVYTLHGLGLLDDSTNINSRKNWADLLRCFQNSKTGYFSKKDKTLHSNAHSTGYVIGALKLLGGEPALPLHYHKNQFKTARNTKRWFATIWWSLIWPGSHKMGEVTALAVCGELDSLELGHLFEWLDKEVNPETGLWERGLHRTFGKSMRRHALGGAAHFWWLYEWYQQPIPYPQKVIATILGLQLESGLWIKKKSFKPAYPFGYDFDALNGLYTAYHQLPLAIQNRYKEKIIACLTRYAKQATIVLNDKVLFNTIYKNSHTLPGALFALAEAEKFYQELTGKKLFQSKYNFQAPIHITCWL